MKKHFTVFALVGLALVGCGDNSEKQETTSEVTMTEQEATASDSLTFEIERATDEVDSLLDEL